MNAPILFGLCTATGWGIADFISRFAGRALGYRMALLGMLGFSALFFSAFVWWLSPPPPAWDPSRWWTLPTAGICMMVATLLLYRGLTHGPMAVVAPIVGAYPAFNLLLGAFLGLRPSPGQLAGMFVVMGGVALVALCARETPAGDGQGGADPDGARLSLRAAVGIALASSLGFAVTVAAAQQAIAAYGELWSVCIMRWIALGAIALLLLCRREAPRVARRWWPVLALQGVLDSGAYLALLFGSVGIGAQIAVVIGSSFSAVTVILARLLLREAIAWGQWAGIVQIVAGVALLAWLS